MSLVTLTIVSTWYSKKNNCIPFKFVFIYSDCILFKSNSIEIDVSSSNEKHLDNLPTVPPSKISAFEEDTHCIFQTNISIWRGYTLFPLQKILAFEGDISCIPFKKYQHLKGIQVATSSNLSHGFERDTQHDAWFPRILDFSK